MFVRSKTCLEKKKHVVDLETGIQLTNKSILQKVQDANHKNLKNKKEII